MKDRVVLASISPMSHNIQRSYGRFTLHGCRKGEPFTTLEIGEQTDHKRIVDQDLNVELIPVRISAQTVADDFLRTERVCFEPDNELEHEGIFQCEKDFPSDAELKRAKEARLRFLSRAIQHGDELFGRLGSRALEQIPDFCKQAVAELGEQRDWVFQGAAPKVQCEGCGEHVKLLDDSTPPAWCPKCGAVLDEKKAARLRPQTVEEPIQVAKENKTRR